MAVQSFTHTVFYAAMGLAAKFYLYLKKDGKLVLNLPSRCCFGYQNKMCFALYVGDAHYSAGVSRNALTWSAL